MCQRKLPSIIAAAIFIVIFGFASLATAAGPQTTADDEWNGDDQWNADNERTTHAFVSDYDADEAEQLLQTTSPIRQVMLMQPTPFLEPRVASVPMPAANTSPQSLTARLFDNNAVDRSTLRTARQGVDSLSNDLVIGSEARSISTTDVGSLLRKSPAALSIGVQRRTPIVNDPRVRSSRIGSLAASGSHWVPARADLDTSLSKIDSRLIKDVIVVPGPYSSLYGPGFQFVDFELLPSPRSDDGLQWFGRTSVDHNSNGNQYLGQQSLWGGGEDWGLRATYSHRTGDSYRAGNGDSIAAGYESREFSLAAGRDLGDGRSIEFSMLRLDQTDVEFPGYVFDIDYLVTDAYDLAYIDDHAELADRTETELWYNRTRFEGSALSDVKRRQFPLLDQINYVGSTDVDSTSTGYRQAFIYGEDTNYRFTLGHDLRFIKQELNEISNGTPINDPNLIGQRNSPIPDSFSANPGLFAEYNEDFLADWNFRTGLRVDYVQTDIVDDPAKLQNLTFAENTATAAEILGTNDFQTDRVLWSLYGSLGRQYCEHLEGAISIGYAERPPTLTELYAIQPFLLLLQNGLNTVTGSPDLDNEKLLQFDINFDYNGEYIRTGARAFHGWAYDYVTFENTRTFRAGLNNEVQQVSLQYVNTDLATLAGFESFLELLPKSQLTPFATMRYVDGRDRTRNGNFATRPGRDGRAAEQVSGLSRGAFSFVSGADDEPLPGILPLESRVGVRLKDDLRSNQWNLELAARIVDNQDRVATSLFESATPGFTVWDLRGTYQPNRFRGLTLVSGLENFTDKNYREHLDFRSFTGTGIFQPGINAYVGADWLY